MRSKVTTQIFPGLLLGVDVARWKGVFDDDGKRKFSAARKAA